MTITNDEYVGLRKLTDRDHKLGTVVGPKRALKFCYEIEDACTWAVEQVKNWRVQFPNGVSTMA